MLWGNEKLEIGLGPGNGVSNRKQVQGGEPIVPSATHALT